MKCMVTGATGHIGNVLVHELHGHGYDVFSLVMPHNDPVHVQDASTVVYGDVTDLSSLNAAFAGMDTVLHLAGIVDIGTHKRKQMMDVNIGGMKNVIAACKKNRVRRLVYTSSVHAIPELPHGQIMSEPLLFDPKRVVGMYAKTKAAATICALGAKDDGLEVVVALPSGVIGPYDHETSHTAQLFTDFLKGRLTAYVDGHYNFVDVRDVACGIRLAMEKGRSGQCYILSGHKVSVEDLLRQVAIVSGQKNLKTKLPFWFALGTSYLSERYYMIRKQKPLYTHYSMTTLQSNCDFSNRKAKRELGFSPRPLEDTIRDATLWALQKTIVPKRKRGLWGKTAHHGRLAPQRTV